MEQQTQISIGEHLASLRKQHGYSQKALAERLSVSRQTVSKWERNEALPDTENLIALSRLYGITIDALINGTSPSEEEPKAVKPDSDEEMDPEAPEREDDEEHRSVWLSILKTLADFSPVIITVIFFLWGYFMDAFHLAWTLYILIPVLHSLYDCVRKRAVSHFAYPILITFIYMLLGFTTGLWHPMWVLYITIPIFYSIATAIDRAMRRKKRAKEIGS